VNALGICLAGPTASGMSALAPQLAEHFQIEIPRP
jgi:tRNA A37 N6-isopentenylltransferase MiaA